MDIQPLDEGDQIREMYARYGLAMYSAQVMEAGIRQALVMAKLSSNDSATRIDYDNLMSNASTNVLGRLIAALKPFLEGDESLVSDLALALRIRNQLAHHFFWDHSVDAISTPGRNRMIAESIAFIELFDDVTTRLENVTRQYLSARHMTEPGFEAMVLQEFQFLQNRDPSIGLDLCIRCEAPMNTVQSSRRQFQACPQCGTISLA